MRPLVSIVFPCYNVEKYLHFSLESILNQDYSNLEIICINDGSSDNTLQLLTEYKTADTRITIVNNPHNLGLISSLNNALQRVSGDYFARMDADDYCPPDRISKQMDFISANQHYDLISTGYNYFIKDDKQLEYVPPIGYRPNSLRFISLFSTPLTHASALGKTTLIKRALYWYDSNYPHSEDFELFSRLTWQGVSIANLPDSLYWVRLNPDSVSVKYNATQIKSHIRVTMRNLEEQVEVKQQFSEAVLQIISNRINTLVSIAEIKTGYRLLEKFLEVSKGKVNYSPADRKEIRRYLNLHQLNILIQSNKIGFRIKKIANFPFMFQTLLLMRPAHLPFLFRKIVISLRYR